MGFKAAGGVVRPEDHPDQKAPGENTAQALDAEALLEFRTSQQGCVSEGHRDPGLHLAHWHHQREALTHSGSSGKEAEFKHTVLSKQSHVASA